MACGLRNYNPPTPGGHFCAQEAEARTSNPKIRRLIFVIRLKFVMKVLLSKVNFLHRCNQARTRARIYWTIARRWQAERHCRSPFARVRAAIHVQYFTRGERGVGRKQSCVDDFFDFTDPADRVQPFEKVISFRFMHGSMITPGAMVFTRMRLPSRIQWRGRVSPHSRRPSA